MAVLHLSHANSRSDKDCGACGLAIPNLEGGNMISLKQNCLKESDVHVMYIQNSHNKSAVSHTSLHVFNGFTTPYILTLPVFRCTK